MEQKGLYEEAIAFHQRGLETDPLSEGLYRCLMACHHRLGRRAEALALYQRCPEDPVSPSGHRPLPGDRGAVSEDKVRRVAIYGVFIRYDYRSHFLSR